MPDAFDGVDARAGSIDTTPWPSVVKGWAGFVLAGSWTILPHTSASRPTFHKLEAVGGWFFEALLAAATGWERS